MSVTGAATSDFERLYEDYRPIVWRYLRRRGAAADDVDDLANEVFIIAFQRRDDETDQALTPARLLVTARDVLGNYRRRSVRDDQLLEHFIPEEHSHRFGGADPSAALLSWQEQRRNEAVRRCGSFPSELGGFRAQRDATLAKNPAPHANRFRTANRYRKPVWRCDRGGRIHSRKRCEQRTQP